MRAAGIQQQRWYWPAARRGGVAVEKVPEGGWLAPPWGVHPVRKSPVLVALVASRLAHGLGYQGTAATPMEL